jgi:hemoglobin-like flavoprotein
MLFKPNTMTPDLLTPNQLASRISELTDLITHMERIGYGHLATTIKADIYILNKELAKRNKTTL